jgi:hypothetical protein
MTKLSNGSGNVFAAGHRSASRGCCNSLPEHLVYLSMASKIFRGQTDRDDLRLRRVVTRASYPRVTLASTEYAMPVFSLIPGIKLTPFQIDLPPYTDYESLEQKLTLAVECV